jgi:archaeal type IV pilus assembly protein PilA
LGIIKVFELMAFTKNDEAVSPVIGVILMVAITVILAAVIAAFVFGMAGNIQKSHTVAATVQQPNATAIIVTFQGGQDAASVTGINVSVNGGTALPMNPYTVGSQYSVNTGTTGKDTVVVTAYFTDGASQVILDTTV